MGKCTMSRGAATESFAALRLIHPPTRIHGISGRGYTLSPLMRLKQGASNMLMPFRVAKTRI